MSTLGEAYGFQIETGVSLSRFYGFQIEQKENLVLYFNDKNGEQIELLDWFQLTGPGDTVEFSNYGNGFVELIITVPGTYTATILYESVPLVYEFYHGGEGYFVFHIMQYPPSPIINYDPDNRFNFIRWHKAFLFSMLDGVVGVLDSEDVWQALGGSLNTYVECEAKKEIPNNYSRSKMHEYEHPFLPTDKIKFILNFIPDFEGDVLGDIRLSIVDRNGNILNDDLPLAITECSGVDYYHGEFNFPSIGYGNGYRFVIYNPTSGAIYYFSNPFRVVPTVELPKYPRLTYRNSCDMFGYPYTCLSDKDTQIRIDLNLLEEQGEIQVTQYRERSTGFVRNQKTQTAKVVKAETYFFDRFANDMMLALSTHDNIKINGKIMEVKTPHAIKPNKLNNTWKGEIEFYDQEYSTVNLHG